MKFSVLSSQFSVFSAESLHPVNAAGLVLNGTMLLCLAVVIILGRRKLKARKRGQALTLLTEPRQCLLGFKRLGNARSKASLEEFHRQLTASLPPLTTEDRL